MALSLRPIPLPDDARSFAAVDVAIVNWLSQNGCESVSTDGPDKASSWPHVMVTLTPAGTAGIVTDSSTADVEVFHPDYDAAADASRVVHFLMLRLRTQEVAGQQIDDARGPSMGFEDYGDDNLVRFMSTYVVDSRAISPLS